MSEQKEALKQMLQHVINGNEDNANEIMHDYFVSKTREISGLSPKESSRDGDDIE